MIYYVIGKVYSKIGKEFQATFYLNLNWSPPPAAFIIRASSAVCVLVASDTKAGAKQTNPIA
jgi:hypothetical protein